MAICLISRLLAVWLQRSNIPLMYSCHPGRHSIWGSVRKCTCIQTAGKSSRCWAYYLFIQLSTSILVPVCVIHSVTAYRLTSYPVQLFLQGSLSSSKKPR